MKTSKIKSATALALTFVCIGSWYGYSKNKTHASVAPPFKTSSRPPIPLVVSPPAKHSSMGQMVASSKNIKNHGVKMVVKKEPVNMRLAQPKIKT
jgi:predicted membrane-bound mannosyltransferase